MKKLFFKIVSCAFVATMMVSCEKDEPKNEVEADNYSVLIVNQGNYSESNGSLSVIYSDGSIKNNLYSDANGYALASIIESAVDCGSKWALICNNEDKVEIVDKNTFKSVATIKDIPTPRYGVVNNGFLYVTSITGYDGSNGNLYKIDLGSYTIAGKYELKGSPEGILLHNDILWVAEEAYDPATWGSSSAYVERFYLKTMDKKVSTLPETVSAKHLAVDKDGNVWVSLTAFGAVSSIAKVDTVAETMVDKKALEGMVSAGHIYSSKDGSQLYYLYSDGSGYGSAEENTSVNSYTIATGDCVAVAKGNGFYGFGVNNATGEIYSANVNGFMTNSTLYICDSKGNRKNNDNQLVGVGACRFLFPKW